MTASRSRAVSVYRRCRDSQGGRQNARLDMTSKKVLIAEDNRDGAESLRHLLEAWGHQAEAAHDGGSAVERAVSFRPEVVILDINMPVLDGYQAARLLKVADHKVLLIAMTGAPSVETRGRARDAGFHHHYIKPIDLEELKELLDKDTLDHLLPEFRLLD